MVQNFRVTLVVTVVFVRISVILDLSVSLKLCSSRIPSPTAVFTPFEMVEILRRASLKPRSFLSRGLFLGLTNDRLSVSTPSFVPSFYF